MVIQINTPKGLTKRSYTMAMKIIDEAELKADAAVRDARLKARIQSEAAEYAESLKKGGELFAPLYKKINPLRKDSNI